MKKTPLLQLFLLFALLCLTAACGTPLKKPHFYELTRKNQKSYILGTVHIGIPASDLPDYIHEKFQSVGVFATEIPAYIDDGRDEKAERVKVFQKEFERSFVNRKENINKLSNMLSPKAWDSVKGIILEKLKDYKLEANLQEYLTPQIVSTFLEQDTIEVSHSTYYRVKFHSMDMELSARAHDQKKFMIYLDGDEAFGADTVCTDTFYVMIIENFVSGKSNDFDSEYKAIEALYRSGDGEQLAVFLKNSNLQPSERCLLEKRNMKWAQILGDEKRPAFIAVGAGHLYGEHNVLDMLKSKGYAVKRMSEPIDGK